LFVVALPSSPRHRYVGLASTEKHNPEANASGREHLIAAARLGGDYLVRAQKKDGSFFYSYDPLQDRYSSVSYNILRHAGATISLFDLYRVTREVKYLEAARRAVEYLCTRFQVGPGSSTYVLDDDGKAKLGANGLALIALVRDLELTRDTRKLGQAKSLARLIKSLQRPNGALASYYRVRGDESTEAVSLYYPGEAILGLVSLYKLDRDPRLLEVARFAADYLVKTQRSAGILPPDAWLMQALESLYSVGQERAYAQHAVALAEAMISQQYDQDDGEEYAGGFGPGEPRATPAASRAEGLLSAYRLAGVIGDPVKTRIAESLFASTRFQLSQQYTVEKSAGFLNPARTSGGFRESLSSARIRIDYVQHNISSLLGVAQALY
jgi:uncharacterized protein YyaL (SSP411 family)